MKYKCIKEMYLPICDGDGFSFDNDYGYIPVNSIWDIDDVINVIGGEVHLEAVSGVDDYNWIEITKEDLFNNLEEINE